MSGQVTIDSSFLEPFRITDYSKVGEKKLLCEHVANTLGLTVDQVRLSNATGLQNAVNRMHYEAGWRNPTVLIARYSTEKDLDLEQVRKKVEQYVEDYPKLHFSTPRLRLVIFVEDYEVKAVDNVSFVVSGDEGAGPIETEHDTGFGLEDSEPESEGDDV